MTLSIKLHSRTTLEFCKDTPVPREHGRDQQQPHQETPEGQSTLEPAIALLRLSAAASVVPGYMRLGRVRQQGVMV